MRIRNSLSNSNLALDIDILDSIFFEDGWVAQEFELKLLRVKSIREKTREKFDGSSELFSVNPIEYARENGWLDR